jgi:NADH dehydrogenase
MLQRKHVGVRFGASVVDYSGRQVALKSGELIEAMTLIWAAGVQAASLSGGTGGLNTARQRRVVVTSTLQAPDHPDVFVIGDAAYVEHDGQPLPMMAPVALQQAETAAENIRRLIAGRPLQEFHYSDPGSLATIGRHAAVAYVKRVQFKGFLAWVVWLVIHLVQLIGFRNKLFVLLSWAWEYFFYERAVRLISARQGGATDQPAPSARQAPASLEERHPAVEHRVGET